MVDHSLRCVFLTLNLLCSNTRSDTIDNEENLLIALAVLENGRTHTNDTNHRHSHEPVIPLNPLVCPFCIYPEESEEKTQEANYCTDGNDQVSGPSV
jgi:hypothetical protein